MGMYSGRTIVLEGAIVGDVGEGMTEDGIRARAVGNFAGRVFDVPGGDEGGLLYGGEEILLFLEDDVGLTSISDVAEEEDNAIVEGAATERRARGSRDRGRRLRTRPGCLGPWQRSEVIEDFAGIGDDGKLLPEVFAKKLAFWAEQLFGTPIEKGEVPVTIDAGDRVRGRFENLTELADGGVPEEFGSLPVCDVGGKDDDAVFIRAGGNLEPDVERFGVDASNSVGMRRSIEAR